MDTRIDANLLLSQALNDVKEKAKGRDPEQLRKAAEQFEAIFLQQMFKEMRNTVPDDGLLSRKNADDIYSQMQDAEAAKVLAERGGVGLAELMMKQLMDEDSE